jgi:MFS family permease
VPAPGDATAIGARLDRLAWSGRHTTILVALGAGWLFDAFEVQLFSSAVGPLGDHFNASVTQRDAILGVWLGGILVGALLGGRLTDRFGRRRLFVATLVWYAGFTVLTGLSPTLWALYLLRFLAALGVGAEYAIVNAATSWRYMFVLGGLLAFVVLVFRRRIPESPRWLAARGRDDEAERIMADLEQDRSAATDEADVARTPEQRGLGAALLELVREHPGRLALGAALDLAEAFGYYGLFALLSVVVLPQVHIGQAQIPAFYIVGNVGALAGGLLMATQLDRLGRHRTVGVSYGAAAAGVVLLAAATATGSGAWVTVAFVVANGAATAAWTSAYPTFTELFPTHLRGAGVGASVAVGRVGAIVGTFLLPSLATRIGASAAYLFVVAFWLAGAVAMVVCARRGGPEAARRPLETLAGPRRAAVAA